MKNLKQIYNETDWSILENGENYGAFLQKFAKMLEKKAYQYFADKFGEDKANGIFKKDWKVKVKPGKKYIKVDLGNSGKFMMNKNDGHLYFIKGYGKVDLRKNFGRIDNIIKRDFDFDGYSIVPKGLMQKGYRSAYGWGGKIA